MKNASHEIVNIEVDGHPTRVLKSGSGKPLLLLHGWGCTAETLAGIGGFFSDDFTSYSVDFPGFGQSEPPSEAWHIADYCHFTKSLIEKLEINGCDVIAHSFGGRIMLKLMADSASGELVSRVLITGGAGMKPKRKPSYYFRKYTAKLLKAPFSLLPGALQEKGLSRLRKTAVWKKLGSSDYSKLDGVMRQVFVHTVTEFQEVELPKINHSVLLLWGENDDVTPLYQARRMEKGIKNAALVTIPGAGHYAFLDNPARFNTIAKAFFTG